MMFVQVFSLLFSLPGDGTVSNRNRVSMFDLILKNRSSQFIAKSGEQTQPVYIFWFGPIANQLSQIWIWGNFNVVSTF